MTRVVGQQDRDEFILDPVLAWHRGRALDEMLKSALVEGPKGVRRATHAVFNALDDERQLAQARRLNDASR